MSKGKNIFHKKDESITSKEDIFDYLKNENEEELKSAPSPSPLSSRSEMDTTPNLRAKKKNNPGEKKSKDNHAFEKRMLSDPFLEEAVEGYSQLKDKEKVASLLKEINHSISPRSAGDENRKVVMRIAALLLVLFLISGGAYYLFDGFTREEMVAVKKEGESKNQEPTILKDNTNVVGNLNQDTISTLALESTLENEEKKEELKSISQKPVLTDGYAIGEIQSNKKEVEEEKADLAFQNPELGPVNNSIERGISVPQGPEEENTRSISNTPKDISYADDEIIKEMNESRKSGASNKAEEKKAKKKSTYVSDKVSKGESLDNAPASTTVKVASLEYGISLYNQSNYTEAKDVFEGVLLAQPSNQEAIFYGGMSDYKLGNYDKAIIKLKKIAKGSRHYDEARWSMALIYKTLGQKKEALALFKILAIPGNAYSDKANQEIKEME